MPGALTPAPAACGRAPQGFTLVEVLVALLLMAVMSAMAWRGLDGMLRARDLTQESIERSATLQTALAQWELDLEQVQPTGLVGPPLAFDGASLRFTRRQAQGLQVVVWTLDQGKWCRWASPPVTSLAALRQAWERSEQPLVLAAERLTVFEGVSDWQLYYLWDNAWANALSTGDDAPVRKEPQAPAPPNPPASGASAPPPTAPNANEPNLPRGVRLQLQFGPGSGLSGTLTRQLLLAGSA